MTSPGLRRSVPTGIYLASGMRSLHMSRIVGRQTCFTLSVNREFKLEASRRSSLCPSSVDFLRGHPLQRLQLASKKLGRLLKGNWGDGRSSITSRAVRFTTSREQSDAVTVSSVRQWWSGRCRSVEERPATSCSPDATSIEECQILASGEDPRLESGATPFRKKKVALWIGYVGTGFNGLQIIRGSDAVNTVEQKLERAIFKAGGILKSNYGHLDKISWSRSSRTDKGVHSLSTVITMKMEIPASAWVGDPDGLLLADSINAHLPPTIQVFGIVPVTKSFEARRFCCNRTYQYLLPASFIGISKDSSPEGVGQVIENFRSILNMFQGRFPFHNYTIRRLYRIDFKSKGQWHKNRRRPHLPVKPVEVEDQLDEDADVSDLSVEVPGVTTPTTANRIGRLAYWLDTPDLADKLSAAHFRRIFECSCGGLENYIGTQFVRISITGESFMIHQIRKMVATAVAVSRGVLPLDTIPLSLCRHTRIVLPLAPSDGLLLAKNSFYPFRQILAPPCEREFRESDVGMSRLKELPKLEISKQMSRKVDIFWSDVLLPHLAPQLDVSLPVWSFWLENLPQATISEVDLEEVRTSYITWRKESQLKMEAADQGRA